MLLCLSGLDDIQVCLRVRHPASVNTIGDLIGNFCPRSEDYFQFSVSILRPFTHLAQRWW